MKITWNPTSTLLLHLALLYALAGAASLYDYYDDNVDDFQNLLASSNLQPPPFYSTAPFANDEDSSDEELNDSDGTIKLDVPSSPSSSKAASYYDYITRNQNSNIKSKPSKNNNNKNDEEFESNLLAFKQWLKAKRSALSDIRTSKRSPSCMRRCIAQRLLHPSQCHSLC